MVPGKNRASGTGKGRKGKALAKGARKTKGKGEAKRKRPSRAGDTRRARERASGLIDPSLHVVVKDERRIQILAIAVQRLISPSEFAEEAKIAINIASYHFRVLREHGFLELVKERKVRGAVKHMHRATKSGFISDANWGEVADALRPGVAGQILQDFNTRVSQAIETGVLFTRDDACLYWVPRDLDEIAYLKQVEMIKWCIEESEKFQVETVDRRANGESKGSFHATFAIAGFPSPTHAEVKAKGERDEGERKAPKAKRKRPSRAGDTRRARERASGLIDPSLHVVVKDGLRIQILAIAVERLISPSEFAEEAKIAINVASYHFRVLREHGFLELVKERKVRGAIKHMHRATKSGFISDANWGEVADALRPGVAGQILQDFNTRVSQAIETGVLLTRDDACLYWVPRDLDEIAYLKQVEMIKWCIEESEKFEVETVERRANGESKSSFHAIFAIAGFPSPTHAEVKAKEAKDERDEWECKAPKAKRKAKGEAKRKHRL